MMMKREVIRYLLILCVLVLAIDVVDSLVFSKATFLNLRPGKDLRMFGFACLVAFARTKDIFHSKRILIAVLLCFILYLGNKFSGVSVQIGAPINWLLLTLWGILVAYLIKTREKIK
jgi:hypothetical protein